MKICHLTQGVGCAYTGVCKFVCVIQGHLVDLTNMKISGE